MPFLRKLFLTVVVFAIVTRLAQLIDDSWPGHTWIIWLSAGIVACGLADTGRDWLRAREAE